MKLFHFITPLLALSAAFAQGPRTSALKTYLNLTDDQVTSIRTALKSSAESNKTLFTELRSKQQELDTLLSATAPDPAAVGKLVVDMRALRTQFKDANAKVTAATTAVLTADQQTKLAELTAASKLQREIGEARALNLIEGGAGPGFGPGHGGHGGPGGMRAGGARARFGARQ